jgi:hypothetical protein
VPKLESILDSLRGRLRAGVVIDAALASKARTVIDDCDVPADAPVVVSLNPPASSDDLRALDAAVLRVLSSELPRDYRTFLATHDGVWTDVAWRAFKSVTPHEILSGRPADQRAFSAIEVVKELQTICDEGLLPPAHGAAFAPPVVPFFQVPDQGWHTLDVQRGGGVVALFLEEPDGAIEIAPSFSHWLNAWIESGFDPFWYE